MTEVEWITTRLPLYMLREYPLEWDVRKARLYACACLRDAANAIWEEWTWRLVDVVERNPENEDELYPAMERVLADIAGTNQERVGHTPDGFALSGFLSLTLPDDLIGFVRTTTCRVAMGVPLDPRTESETAFALRSRLEQPVKARQADLIREVFGNPFRPVCASQWLTSDVIALARGIYEDRAFDRMPVLADALQDAGCDNVNVLDHCREPHEHVRGCWVIDLLLGK